MLVGCGNVCEGHLEELLLDPQHFQVEAVADIIEERARQPTSSSGCRVGSTTSGNF